MELVKKVVQISGETLSIINIFVFQMEREDTFVVDKTNVANIRLIVYGGQVKQVMIRKKVLNAVIP